MKIEELKEALEKERKENAELRKTYSGIDDPDFARAALADQSALADILQKTEAAKHQIAEIGSQNGLLALPSATNFVCLDCSVVGADARATLSHLSDAGIFVRMPFVAPGDRCIRVSAGPAAEIALFGEALPKAIALAKAGPA